MVGFPHIMKEINRAGYHRYELNASHSQILKLLTRLISGMWTTMTPPPLTNYFSLSTTNCSRKSYATQFTFFNPWFRTAHRHLMTLDFAPMTNFCSINFISERSWIYHSHALQRQLLIITTCTLDYVLVCLFCYRLCISCHKLRLSAFL